MIRWAGVKRSDFIGWFWWVLDAIVIPVMSEKRLILGSGSPRRRELLEEMGYVFEVVTTDVEEVHDAGMGLAELCELNAALKARAVTGLVGGDAVVLGGDTLVSLDGEALGKPKSEEEAVGMLRRLSGRAHEVCTGMCLVGDGREERFHVVTEVVFKELDDGLIREYMGRVDVMDKAGSYAVQECGEMIVEEVRGDFSNVVGLPQEELRKRLEGFGLQAGG